jgi:hypothetical protein
VGFTMEALRYKWRNYQERDDGYSVGSDKLDKLTIDNRANLSIIDNRLSITIIIELGPWQYYRATTGLMRYIYRPYTTFSLLQQNSDLVKAV